MPKILIIDDDEQVRLVLRLMLQREGYEIEEASNGLIAIEKYKENPSDLIITDIVMPEKEGIETIMELQKDYPEIKIIAISGGGSIPPDIYLTFAKKLGAFKTFTKPIERETLLKAVKELLEL